MTNGDACLGGGGGGEYVRTTGAAAAAAFLAAVPVACPGASSSDSTLKPSMPALYLTMRCLPSASIYP